MNDDDYNNSDIIHIIIDVCKIASLFVITRMKQIIFIMYYII